MEDFSALVEEYYRRYPALRGRETVTWCFDEIQVVAGWERFVRRLLDSEKVEIVVSGSSATASVFSATTWTWRSCGMSWSGTR